MFTFPAGAYLTPPYPYTFQPPALGLQVSLIFSSVHCTVQLSREFAFKLRIQDSVRHRRGNPWRQKFPPYWTPENPHPAPVKEEKN